MKKVFTIILFTLLAFPVPVAVLGAYLTWAWFWWSAISGEPLIATLAAMLGIIIAVTYCVVYAYAFVKTWCIDKKVTFRTFLPAIHCVLALVYLTILPYVDNYADDFRPRFGFVKNDFIVVEDVHDYGGFPADGYSLLVLDCSENKSAALENVKDWKKLPLTQNLNALINGGVLHGCNYWGIGEEVGIPHIENGYYLFIDDGFDGAEPYDDTRILEGGYNFRIAIYDTDTNRVYILEYDT